MASRKTTLPARCHRMAIDRIVRTGGFTFFWASLLYRGLSYASFDKYIYIRVAVRPMRAGDPFVSHATLNPSPAGDVRGRRRQETFAPVPTHKSIIGRHRASMLCKGGCPSCDLLLCVCVCVCVRKVECGRKWSIEFVPFPYRKLNSQINQCYITKAISRRSG